MARNTVVLTFNSNLGRDIRLTIPRADMTLTSARVQATMEAMIAGGSIVATGGIPATIRGAELVTTVRSALTA